MQIQRLSFDVADLFAIHPPSIAAEQKRRLFELCTGGRAPVGTLEIARYVSDGDLGERYDPSAALDVALVFDHFTYDEPAPDFDAWHLNFADPDLFCAYGTNLFAQDEIQVAEHPALASVREALLERDDLPPFTVEGGPTPILIRDVPRVAAIDTADIYGWRFARANDLAAAVTPLDPPTRSNILAMAAPSGGRGRYRSLEITHALATAYTGFAGARAESERSRPGSKVEVHTGFWGCGAFGGNRVLLPMLQIVAARNAGIDRLVFHVREDTECIEKAKAVLDEIAETPLSMNDLVQRVTALGFEWGVPDGN